MYIFAFWKKVYAMDFSHILTDPYVLALTAVLALAFIVLVLYYALFYFRLGHYRQTKRAAEEPLPPVSIVLCSQNQGEWLRSNLIYLLEQDYPEFEVVVVNYCSTDETKFVLQVLSENYKHLKVVTMNQNVCGYRGKKYPLSIGIKSAQHDLLLLADPDCLPRDVEKFNWIRQMVAGYCHKNIDIVLGYTGIERRKSLFNWLQQYDNMDYSVEYLGAAIMHCPFTGNGRNLSYRRSFFMENNGLIYNYNEPNGADDMFVNQNARRHNVSVVLEPESFTMAVPRRNFREWHSLRKHRVVTHKYYKFGLKACRLVRPLSVLLFYAAAALLLVSGLFPWEVLAGVVALKWAWQIVSVAQSCKRLLLPPVVYVLSPVWEIYFLIANTILSIIPLSKSERL